MSSTWYPGRPNGGWEIDVPNPGYGEIFVYGPAGSDWSATLNGPEIGEFVNAVTRRAVGTEKPESGGPLPRFLDGNAAREILLALVQATVLAAAGTDRSERTFTDAAEAPHHPICSLCNEGTYFSPGALPSKHCDEYGHRPYGFGAETRWSSAQQTHELRSQRWERLHAR